MMKPAKRKIEVFQGKTYICSIKIITSETGPPLDLTGYSIRMQIRKEYSSEEALLTLTSDDGDFSIDESIGKATLTISAEDTASLDAGYYKYDIEFFNNSGYVFCPFYGTFRVRPEVTRDD